MTRDDRKNRHLEAGVLVDCRVCNAKEPKATADDHHLVPRAFGGTDDPDNRVWLCASCHKRLHRVQGMLIHNKPNDAYDLTEQLFPNYADKRARLWQFANIAAQAELRAKESFASHRTHVKVSIEVDAELWDTLKEIAKREKKSAKELAAAIIEDAIKKVKA